MTIQELGNYGFNVAEALELCVDDEEILMEVLETALEEGREKIPIMKSLMEQGDFDRYIIEAHGLKNASKQIGCDRLSEMAKASELSGKAGDLSFVMENHAALMEEYQKVVDAMAMLF